MEENSIQLINIEVPNTSKEEIPLIVKLSKIGTDSVSLRKSELCNTLLDPVCVRHNHNLISVYCYYGVVVKVRDKIRALKSMKVAKGDRKNWAATIIHMLDRPTSSNVEIDAIWKNVTAIVSDLCKVNKQLAAEIQKLIGSEWLPGQV